jgi:DNA polymerase-1
MEQTGIAVDQAVLKAQLDELTQEVDEIAQQAYKIIGHEVNLASPKQLQTVLFEELGMQGTRSVKTGYSTNAEALQTLFEQNEHPFLERLLAHRDVSKLRQITETLVKAIEPDGRIHTMYSQVTAATGRLSSENPNLQNIPIKTERGQRLRSAFVAGEGFETLLTADYSQIEMRIMAHLSADAGLIEAFNAGEDLHSFVGARIYGVEPSEVDSGMPDETVELLRDPRHVEKEVARGEKPHDLDQNLRRQNRDRHLVVVVDDVVVVVVDDGVVVVYDDVVKLYIFEIHPLLMLLTFPVIDRRF